MLASTLQARRTSILKRQDEILVRCFGCAHVSRCRIERFKSMAAHEGGSKLPTFTHFACRPQTLNRQAAKQFSAGSQDIHLVVRQKMSGSCQSAGSIFLITKGLSLDFLARITSESARSGVPSKFSGACGLASKCLLMSSFPPNFIAQSCD